MGVLLHNQLLRDAVKSRGYQEPPGQRLHLFGVRGALVYTDTQGRLRLSKSDNRPNEYNDVLGVFGTELLAFLGSTDPGRHWTLYPSNHRGAATLLPGVSNYKLGLHRGKRALVQAGAVTVIRDSDRDGKAEPHEPHDHGYFGINIHAGGSGPKVERWSAGCQVIAGGWEGDNWREFINCCEDSGQAGYTYYLLEWADVAKVAG